MAVDIFLKPEGINGESEDAKHSKEIDILGWNWGMSNTGTAHLGGGAGTGKVNIHDLSVIKYVDLASTPLMLSCAQGKHITTATQRTSEGFQRGRYVEGLSRQVCGHASERG